MAISRSIGTVSIVLLISLILLTGCGPQGGDKITTAGQDKAVIALSFAVGDATSYKSVIDSGRGLKLQGAMTKDSKVNGGYSGTKIDMDFTQEIKSITKTGNAVANITIDRLKVLTQVKGVTSIDFDSSKKADKSNILYGLIGKSYTIELTPDGKVARIVNAKEALKALKGEGPEKRFGERLLTIISIEQRHSIAALGAAGSKPLKVNDSWSTKKQEKFGMLGAKSYEKIYTLKDIKRDDSGAKATVSMIATPDTSKAKQEHEKSSANPFAEMFDNQETYSGILVMDISTGKIDKYSDKLDAKWTITDPQAKESAEPNIIIMSEIREISLEKIK